MPSASSPPSRAGTPPLPPMTSAFGAAAAEPFPSPVAASWGASPLECSRAGSGALNLATKKSMSRQSSVKNPFAVQPGAPQLWRESTAVTERAHSLGFSSLADLCGDSYIPPERLHKPKSLGEGAFAVVDIATLEPGPSGRGGGDWPTSAPPRRPVAVKRLKPHVLEVEDDVLSFIQEARLLVSLKHPSIIEFIGVGCTDDSTTEAQWRTMYLVQEYASGGTLKKLLLNQMINPTKKLFSLQDAARWAHQMAEGLAFLHQLNPMIMHRDLKAENVLLTPGPDGEMRSKLADFGLHKMVPLPGKAQLSFHGIKEEGSQHGSAHLLPRLAGSHNSTSGMERELSLRLTANSAANPPTMDNASWQHGALLRMAIEDRPKPQGRTFDATGQTGAFVYMAPEVLLGTQYNEKVDVFSFGMVLYELLHRKMVVADLMYLGTASDAEAFAYKVAAGYRLPISAELPEGLRALIAACMAPSPDDRPSMAEVVQHLAAVRESGDVEAAEHLHGPGSGGCCTVM